jgi:obg-like ATPase 1
VESKYQRGEKALKADYESLQKVKKTLVDEKKHIRFGDWNAFDIEVLNKNYFSRLKNIPVLLGEI